ncbi:MAG: CRISPR-associated ring nuclease [Armatimonadota bacterium]|nr:CRISPR-associated ring nuclease [Armatimonadota bacterium]
MATLGHEPQVVTITLDLLLAQRRSIREVIVVHTASKAVQAGLRAIREEFASGLYPGVHLRAVPVRGPDGPLEDFRSEADVRGLLAALYRAVRDGKRAHPVVHLSLAGGRKVMGVAAMVVAQLLFGPEDRAWHLLSEGWQPGAERRMHLQPGETAYLVPVPVLRWTDSGLMLAALAELDDPMEAIRRYEEIVRGERMRRRREFVERWLTPAEREVARLACQGLDNAGIARRLGRSPRTVANQLSQVYSKMADWLGFDGPPPSRPQLLAELAPYFEVVASSKRGA